MASDPYSTLGVAKGTSEADIKKAYRKLAKELHPDTNKDNPKAAERFAKVTQAYDLLSDKTKRAQFDRGEIDGDGNPAFGGFGGGGNPFGGGGNPFGRGGQGGGFSSEGIDLGDIFDGLFGGGRAKPQSGGGGPFGGFGGGGRQPQPRGGNVNYRLNVPFEDAARLKAQRITLQDGKSIDLKLPNGVESGTQMRLGGKGQQGPGGAGDAIVTIDIARHRFFEREGDNIRLDLPITLVEAVNGAAVKVPTVDGAVMLTVPRGSSSGKVLRLKEKGFAGKDGKRGDQLVTLMIDVPEGDAALAKFVAKWGDDRNPRARLGV